MPDWRADLSRQLGLGLVVPDSGAAARFDDPRATLHVSVVNYSGRRAFAFSCLPPALVCVSQVRVHVAVRACAPIAHWR
eukprot:12140852-Alexandrium_andersonii.AAC.1